MAEQVEMTSLTIRLPEQLLRRFKIACVMQNIQMGAVVNQCIEGYLAVREEQEKEAAQQLTQG